MIFVNYYVSSKYICTLVAASYASLNTCSCRVDLGLLYPAAFEKDNQTMTGIIVLSYFDVKLLISFDVLDVTLVLFSLYSGNYAASHTSQLPLSTVLVSFEAGHCNNKNLLK